MKVVRNLFLVLMVAVLAGCGFQLRGTPNWPADLSPVYVAGLDARNPFQLLLEQSLRSAGIEVASSPSADVSEIRVLALQEQSRVLTVTGDARISEYRLIRRLETELHLPGDPEPIPLGALETRQDYSFDAAAVLSQEAREDELRLVMNRDLVRLLQYRVRAATGGISPPVEVQGGT